MPKVKLFVATKIKAIGKDLEEFTATLKWGTLLPSVLLHCYAFLLNNL